jgi:hypothetical protein
VKSRLVALAAAAHADQFLGAPAAIRLDRAMSRSELSILLDADDPVACEYPAGFDWSRAIAEVRSLKPEVERIAGRTFQLDDQVQDASFFAELAVRKPSERVIETVFSASFSCFGRLFTDWANCASERLPPQTATAIIERIRWAGFVHVSEVALALPYSGRNPVFDGQTWGNRFFDYL